MFQGSLFVLFTHRIRRWLLLDSFTPACVLLGNRILPLWPSSPFPNSDHYPEFPSIHLSLLPFPYTCNPGAFVLLCYPSYSFFLWKLTLQKFLALLSPSGQIFAPPRATVPSLGPSWGDRTVVPWRRDHNHLENNLLFGQPWVWLQNWGHHSSPCVSLIIPTGVSSCFLNLMAVTIISPKQRCNTV